MALENADQQVLKQLAQWIQNGHSSWLCTVVKTWGSSPRPVGSLLACNDEGHLVGSLSGGCIEEDLLEKLQLGEMATTAPEVLIYGVSQAETERFGLPCGGSCMLSSNLSGIQRTSRRLRQWSIASSTVSALSAV